MKHIFVKNLTFPSETRIRLSMIRAASSADYISALLHLDYRENGVQVQVSKAVSDDLQATDFPMDALVSDVPWLGECMEFYYHDPELPSMLMTKSKVEGHILVGMEDTDKQYCTLNLPQDMRLEFITSAMAPSMVGALPLTDDETAILHRMYILALKVMAFASIPKYRPPSITRKQMHHGGKPGVHERPKRPAYQVVYLPRVIREHQAQADQAGRTHQFKGRRGVIHNYYHDRFVNRKGTWDYYPPLVDPATGKYPPIKTVYKVRKVEV